MNRTSDSLFDDLMLDLSPTAAAMCDFGIDSQDILEAYQRKIRSGEVTREQLQDAVCDGKKLTALIGIQITTLDLGPEDDDDN
jgi:hypothetical protein